MNGEEWLPPEFGISMISDRFERRQVDAGDARRIVAVDEHQRPSVSPLVCDSSGWWASSQGMKPWEVSSIGLVSSLKP
jgi:hypothetical protein